MQQEWNIIANTSLGHDFGTFILMDSLSGKVTYYHLVHSAKDIYYNQGFLNEQSHILKKQGYFPYKHLNVRLPPVSITILFIYEKYVELNIEKTTNRRAI